MHSDYRTFTIVDYPNENENTGRYIGKTPKKAAKKAFSRLSRELNIKNSNNKNFLVFSIRELGTNNIYKYIGTRIELIQPKIVKINGKIIKYKYEPIITSYNKFIGQNNLH